VTLLAERYIDAMDLLGVGLGVMVALLWGSGDVLATSAARRMTTFKTTFISQVISLLILLVFGTIALWRWHIPFTPTTFGFSALIGIFTGLCAALGYFALYRSLEIGPIAIVGPLTATSPIFTLMLSAFILQEHLTLERKGLAALGILGIILASTSLAELRILIKKPGFSLWGPGIRWAVVATFAFGALDFGIGTSASISNWLLPTMWTRFFSIVFLTLIACGKRYQWLTRRRAPAVPSSDERTLNLSFPTLQDIAYIRHPFSKIGLGILLALTVGIIESAAALAFSLGTRIATTGITSAIASSYALIIMISGMIVYRERLTKNQLLGIVIFMMSLFLLAL
jgi:drug/metabolite transporter (DMT)-like permease